MADRQEVRSCVLHTELHYSVKDHTWVRVNDDGSVTVGMTDIAQSLAGPILHARVKKAGTVRAKGRPVATVESSKWVGPVKLPVSGTVTEVNPDLKGDAQLINRAPYTSGWLVKMDPSNLAEDLSEMVTGDAVVDAYRERLEADGIEACTHIEGFQD
jgi:glycine cleavage system H protein